jgi:hypothetical protein
MPPAITPSVRRALPVVVALTCVATWASAARGQAPGLSAQDVGRADILDTAPTPLPARWQALRRFPAPGTPEVMALVDELAAGRVDPLALLRRLAPRAAVAPPDARYAGACARARGAPSAVWALRGAIQGEADAAIADVAGLRAEVAGRGRATTTAGVPTAADKLRYLQAMGRFANATAGDPRVRRAAAFYRDHGFATGAVSTYVPLRWPHDTAAVRVDVRVYGYNGVPGWRALPACRALGNGPVIIATFGAP